ncbi:nucleoside hydrolase [Rothia uropygialis]|uniref:nucleoside hydrolase n=1 Tax=Kocuria sp. 36 TaxID=1415402 RepID=UPI00101D7CBB|nr:nucleoside hydrolase [Kocuria sp. 36]
MPRILLDNDTGIDDAIALVYLAAQPEVRFEAISCTPGNVPADDVARNNLGLLRLCGREDVPVFLGARQPLEAELTTTPETHGPQGIGHAQVHSSESISDGYAPEVWAELARANPGELDAICTAPLTNFALALRIEPRLPELLRSLTIMGGAFFHPGNTTPLTEWNIHSDPHAAHEVFAVYEAYEDLPEEKLPLVCGLETTERYELMPEEAATWAIDAGNPQALDPHGRGTELLRVLDDALRFYFEFHEEYGYGYMAHVHDFFASAAAIGDATYEAVTTNIDVVTSDGPAYGATVADLRNLLGRRPSARLVTSNDPDQGFSRLRSSIVDLARRVDKFDS